MPSIQDYLDRMNSQFKAIDTELMALNPPSDTYCSVPQEPTFTNSNLDCDPKTQQELLDIVTSFSSSKSAKEEELKLLKQCVDAIQDVATKNQESANKIQELTQYLFKLEQLSDNLSFYYEYHKALVHYFSNDTTPVNIASLLESLATISPKIQEYSTAVSLSINFNFVDVKTFQLAQPSPFSVSVKIKEQDFDSGIYFNPSASFNYSTNKVPDDTNFSGTLYDSFYNKLDDPIEKLFSYQERGLYRKFNNEKDVSDINKFQDFYSNFEINYEKRKAEIYRTKINKSLKSVVDTFKTLARFEAALYRIAYLGSSDNPTIKTSKSFISVYERLTKEISNTKTQIATLRSSISKDNLLNEMLKFDCIKNNYGEIEDRNDNGQDLLTMVYDPTNPNPYKACYWLQFAKIATINGLLPFPDLTNPMSLRYWPVGLVIASFKVPLPMVWIPLIEIATFSGIIVVFIAQCGIVPSPYVLYIANDGSKQFIVTLRGQSEVFGFRGDVNKFTIKTPILTAPDIDLSFKLGMQRAFSLDGFFDFILRELLDFINRFPFPDTSFNFNLNLNCNEIAYRLMNYFDSFNLPTIEWPDRDYLKGVRDISKELGRILDFLNLSGILSDMKRGFNIKDFLKKAFLSLNLDYAVMDLTSVLKQMISIIKLEFDNVLFWLQNIKINIPLTCTDAELDFIDKAKSWLDSVLNKLLEGINLVNVGVNKIEDYILNAIDSLNLPDLLISFDFSKFLGIMAKVFDFINAFKVKLDGIYITPIRINLNDYKEIFKRKIADKICCYINEHLGYLIADNNAWNEAYVEYINGCDVCKIDGSVNVDDKKISVLKARAVTTEQCGGIGNVNIAITSPDLGALLKGIISKELIDVFADFEDKVNAILNVKIIKGMFDAGVTILDIIMMAKNAARIIKEAVESMLPRLYFVPNEELYKKAFELLKKLEQYSWPISAGICAIWQC